MSTDMRRVVGLEILLCAVDPVLAAAYAQVAEHFPGWVSAVPGPILDAGAMAVVSPANSFGFLDGGLDAVYLRRFGNQVQAAARLAVLDRHDGELLVGTADSIATADAAIPYLILAPTMRVPMALPPDTIHPYLAMRAVLRHLERDVLHDGPYAGRPARQHLLRVAVPGLGTGVGRVAPSVCARQVAAALRWTCEPISLPASWADASWDHQRLSTDHPDRLQY